MRIDHSIVYPLSIPLKQVFKTARGEKTHAQTVMIALHTDTGLVGWGEASSSSYITGNTQASNVVLAEEMAGLIKGKDPLAIEARMRDLNGFIAGGGSAVRAAFDLALYDLLGKAAGLPLYQVLGGSRRPLRTDCTIGLKDTVEETVAEAEELLAQNFDAIKLKVGRAGLEDVAHVKALRECVGPDVQIKVDANQGWDYPTAVANIEAMAPFDLEYAEQPLPVWDYANQKRLRDKVALPLCADESVFDDKDAFKLVSTGAVDYLNIKLSKSGGIHTALKINALAEAAGCKCMIGCFSESRLSLSAAAHLAMARPNIAFLDLDSAYSFQSDPVVGGMTYDEAEGGVIHLPDAPGLGAEIRPEVLAACQSTTV
ncbi:mandelate racemase/muconate lactonizing enzyme family protein [Kordiimonas sp.]|uniref:mandelate racemase/muconate lactonizing enzyme family protein n=1 Tax=Kordiimonas sp. TaxID=1970157 RepID=UPI003A92A93D